MNKTILILIALGCAAALSSCAGLAAAKEVVIEKVDKVAEGYCDAPRAIRMQLRRTANKVVIGGTPKPIKLVICPVDADEWGAARAAYVMPLASATAFEDALLAELLRYGHVTYNGKRISIVVEEEIFSVEDDLKVLEDEEVPDEDEP